MSLTVTRCWKLRDEPNSSVLLISIKGDLATLTVRNSLDHPKPLFIAIQTFRLDNERAFTELYGEVSEYLYSYYLKEVKSFVQQYLVV